MYILQDELDFGNKRGVVMGDEFCTQRQFHRIEPVWDAHARCLILGSFPSEASREASFYYAHPQNRFWRVLAAVLNAPVPESVEKKKQLLLRHGIALWDVIASCEVCGSSDSSIRSVVPNDLQPLLSATEIHRIFLNGRTAERFYRKYLQANTGIVPVCLPSTSAANAAWSLQRLCEAWRIVAV